MTGFEHGSRGQCFFFLLRAIQETLDLAKFRMIGKSCFVILLGPE